MTNTKGPLEFGVCAPPPGAERAERLRSAGCDYYEPTVAGALMAAGREEFEGGLAGWSAGGLAARCANVLLPGDLKVVGESVDSERLAGYLAEAFRRAERLGIERVVFGSGTARNVPDGFPRDTGYGQLAEALRLASSAARPGTLVCLEHLRRAETNTVNSLAEAGRIAAELDLANLALVVDAYHLQEEEEDVAVVGEVAARIAHVHVCGPKRRPPSAEDEARLASLFERLGAIGYAGRCSIECHFEDLDEEAPAALDAVRKAAEVAGVA